MGTYACTCVRWDDIFFRVQSRVLLMMIVFSNCIRAENFSLKPRPLRTDDLLVCDVVHIPPVRVTCD